MRRKVNYPDLIRLVRQRADIHRATIVLIEEKASGTQLIQELTNDAAHRQSGQDRRRQGDAL